MVIDTVSKPDNRLLKFLCANWKSTWEGWPALRACSPSNMVYKYNTSRSYNNSFCQPVWDGESIAVGNSTVTQKCPDSSGPFYCDKSLVNFTERYCLDLVYLCLERGCVHLFLPVELCSTKASSIACKNNNKIRCGKGVEITYLNRMN